VVATLINFQKLVMKLWQCKSIFLILTLLTIQMEAPALATTSGRRPVNNHLRFDQEPSRPRTVAGANAEMQSPEAIDEALKKLTAEEQAALNRSGNPRDRVRTYIRLSEARLKNAHAIAGQETAAGIDEQLEAYTALIADAGRFTAASVPPRDKAYKALEQTLREQIRVLEGIRRDVSAAHIDLVEQALATANRVRRQALNALLSDGKALLKDPESDRPKKDPEKQPK